MSSGSRLFAPWLVLGSTCAVAMWFSPGTETIPYHLAWIGAALAYAIEPWPWGRTLTSVVVYTAATGSVLITRAAQGTIAWEETTEIPLMSLLVLVVVWNVRRRHDAYATLSRIAARDRELADQREQLSRMTSHEMRTPATIAMGYAEALLVDELDPGRRVDLEVIRDELERLVLASDRLVRMIRMQDQDDMRDIDVGSLLQAVAERWRVMADRDWVVSADPGTMVCSPDRLRACLDTLLENAVRYTEPGGTVRLLCRFVGGYAMIGVADSGRGLDPRLARALNRDQLADQKGLDEAYLARDPKAKTGFGLALVRQAALARGGRLAAGRSREGGALLAVVVPRVLARRATPEAVPASRRHAGFVQASAA